MKTLTPNANARMLGMMLRDDDGDIIGFVCDVYDNSVDSVCFAPVESESTSAISIADYVRQSFIMMKLKSALRRNPAMFLEWVHEIDLPIDFID